jgi:regulator of protease activity HflC (stomatin/prohibitin superfamily)
VTRNGAVSRVLEPGLHAKWPVIESVIDFNVQVQKEQTDADAASADLQTVHATVAVNYSIDPLKVAQISSNIGTEYKSKVIDPAIQESVKAATAKYTAEELITKRPEVTEEVKSDLSAALKPYDITVSGVSIITFAFSGSFNQAIEAKVTAEQNALAAKNKLEQSKYEADQRVAQAEGEAKAIQIQAQAINSQGGADYVQLKAIEKWNGVLPSQFIPGQTVPFLNLKN